MRNRLDPHPPSVAAGHPVVVAVVDKDGEGERERAAGALERVANVGGVGPLLHPDPLLEPRGPDGVGPDGARALKPPALDLAIAVRLDGAAGPAIRGEGPGLALVLGDLFDLGDEQRPAERGREGGDEEPVVAPGQDGRDRAGGKAPDPVGTEPLPRLARRQIPRELTAPVEHHPSSTSPVRKPCAIRASRGPCGDPGPLPQYATGAPSAGRRSRPRGIVGGRGRRSRRGGMRC